MLSGSAYPPKNAPNLHELRKFLSFSCCCTITTTNNNKCIINCSTSDVNDGGESDGGEGDTTRGDTDKRGSRGRLWLEQLCRVSIKASLSNRKWKTTRLNKQQAHKQTNKLVQKHRQRGASPPCWDSWHPSICSSTPQPRSSATTQSILLRHLSSATAASSCLHLHHVRFVSADIWSGYECWLLW